MQERLAHLAIDSGAHLVLGHHPHVPQPVLRYKHGLIAYSLGNFVFDEKSRGGNSGIILTCRIGKAGVISHTTQAVRIVGCQPQPVGYTSGDAHLHSNRR